MLNRKVSAWSVTALMVIGVTAAFAQDTFTAPTSPEEAVAMRKALMKEDGGLMRTAAKLSGADAVAAMTTIEANYSHIPALFPEGSIVGDSEALPAIWENWETFTAIAQAGQKAAQDGLAAAQAGDDVAYQAAVKTIMGTCGQCHQQFRS